jgi:SAM-dependent methyltransferase
MLHHVQTVAAQDDLFAEAHRVLRPGGRFVGSDSMASPARRDFHADDIFTPVDPHTLPDRLTAAGFTDINVQVEPEGDWFAFSAGKS